MKGLLKYIHTMRYLKGRQIAHLLLYRFPGWYLISRYRATRNVYGQFKWAVFDHSCLRRDVKFEPPDRFLAFHRSLRFGKKWDWATRANGNLWNYHLQYFDFLLDESCSKEIRLQLLRSVSEAILSRKLKMEPYPISLRLIHSYAFLSSSEEPVDLLLQRALALQVRFLEENPEYHLDANHLLENYIALCFSFLFLEKDFKRSLFLSRLIKELEKQVLEDGGHYEGSLSYHCGILSRLLSLVSAMEAKSVDPLERDRLRNIVSGMLAWLNEMTQDLRYFPLFNDCIIWEKGELEKLRASAERLQIVPNANKRSLIDFHMMKRQEGVLWIKARMAAPEYQPGHAHADLLSFVLGVAGHLIFVDPGVSDYEDPLIRRRERSTAYHNTLSLPKANQSEIWASFRMGRRAQITELNRSADQFEAEVVWYQGHVHVRKFKWDEKALIITDSFSIKPESHTPVVAAFHLDFRIGRPTIRGLEVEIPGTSLKIQFRNAQRIELETYLQALRFNELHEAHRLMVYFYGSLETHIHFIF